MMAASDEGIVFIRAPARRRLEIHLGTTAPTRLRNGPSSNAKKSLIQVFGPGNQRSSSKFL
jgi:hypothetical protein